MRKRDIAWRVQKSGCWECTSHRQSGMGYTTVSRDGRQVYAHRIMYERENGPIPAGMCVLHRCDNPACINPAHLFLGTKGDNTRDCIAKGRIARGERHGVARLTRSDVLDIRRPGLSAVDAAAKHGISKSAVFKIRNGDRWGWFSEEAIRA